MSETFKPGNGNAPSGRRLVVVGVIVLIIAAIIVIAGSLLRAADARRLRSWTDAQAVPTVNVLTPTIASHGGTLQLPGQMDAFMNAPIFARVSGYLKSWRVDIGAPVKSGEELAIIDTPEVDQQLLQARADLRTAQANAALAEVTAKRWQALSGTDSVAQQDIDTRVSDFQARQAAVASAQANVDRLVATKGFARIVAPFDGVVTARNTDVGALINAGTGGAGQQLFTVSDVHQLRVYVQVPQDDAPDVQPGATAALAVPAYPGQSFAARVVASAGAVNANSGTTLVQLLVDNPQRKLLPGGFANVTFQLPAGANTLTVPASALVFDANGTRVATVDAQGRAHFHPVTISHDLGDVVQIDSGLQPGDRVIDTPPDGLVDGDKVQIADSSAKAAAHG